MAVGLTVAPAAAITAEATSPPRGTSRPRRGRRGLLRLASFLITVVLATFISFVLIKLVPGDPATAIAGENATAEQLAELRHKLGLDNGLFQQYWHWASRALHGDFGISLYTGQRVSSMVAQRLPITVELVVYATLLSLVIGVPLGVIAAMRRGKLADRVLTGLSSLGVAIPNFWLGMVLVTLFALTFTWFPATGFTGISSGPLAFLKATTLPAVTLAAAGIAEVARQLRSALIEIFASDYMRTSRARGLPRRTMIWRHAFPNAGVTMLTIVGLLVSRMLSATVVVETVFAIPGIGSLVVDAVKQRDYPVLQAVVFVLAVIVLLVNGVVDVLYRRIDPRIEA
ncbi:MAG: transporter permease [Ilumatobacteraceae bacterium]|nr:transporter permease [Ilumatobacteraceae bacterium]